MDEQTHRRKMSSTHGSGVPREGAAEIFAAVWRRTILRGLAADLGGMRIRGSNAAHLRNACKSRPSRRRAEGNHFW